MNPIEQNALYILKLLVDKDRKMSTKEIKKLTHFEDRDINDAIDYLGNRGYVDVLRGLGGVAIVNANSSGRYQYHEIFSDSRGSIIDPDNPSSFEELYQEPPTDELKVFISYSTKDTDKARVIKNNLEDFDIYCFMASEDTEASEEWMEKIFDEITNSDIFIALLSYNFKNSDWCPQELGIACYLKYYMNKQIQIVPLGLNNDEHSRPFGFLSIRIQGQEYNVFNLIRPIFREHTNYMIPKSIDALGKIYGYRKTEFIMGLLEPYYDKLTAGDVNKLVLNAINNDQVYDAGDCKDEYIPKFIDINKDKIEPGNLKKLQRLLDED
ncbi:MAG: toll/interleukin-1 receptor domain-containing protein [Candidatus Atribacteria bacterium]|nr:toll/interleukin-1 receptor domain-containing protein [Candidatus Atribacteria bacterium]